jgi:peptidoglycan/xylan/chitin deacetylase (PgdA/CDA1 family)
MIPQLSRQQLAATALVESGFSRWTRRKTRGETAILTFHGLRRDGLAAECGILDSSLHETVGAFRDVCAHLARFYEVVTLERALASAGQSESSDLPRVAITFDDGYQSNLRLALPVLREFGFPATVFVSTAFVGGELLWFQKLDLAMQRATGERLTLAIGNEFFDLPLVTEGQRKAALGELLAALKKLSWVELNQQVEKIQGLLAVDVSKQWPEVLRPLTKEEVLELSADGLVEIGGHTHRHPVLGRCTDEEAREEILGGAERLREMLGHKPRWFAYPNGGAGDFDSRKCAVWLEEAGFEGAFSMINGRVKPGLIRWSLPRYGAPRTAREAEATVSGAFEVVKTWRQHFKRRAAL